MSRTPAIAVAALLFAANAAADCPAAVPSVRQYVVLAVLACHAIAAQNTSAGLVNLSAAPSAADLRDPQYCVVALASYFASRDRAARPAALACTAGRTVAALQRRPPLADR